jgi:N-formylglutamate amidohydrolase
MSAVYTHGSRGQRLRADDPEHREALLAAFYRPWAAAVAELVQRQLARTGRAVLLDVHSYPSRPLPYELHPDGPRPAVCLGVDPVHTPSWLVEAAREAFDSLGPVALDTPFRGTYVPLPHHRHELRVSSIMVEIRRDTYLVEPDGPPTSGLDDAARGLAELVDAATRTS